MKTAIVYYSMNGNTHFAAEMITKQLEADLLPLYPVAAYPDKGFRKFFWGGKSAVMKEEPPLAPYAFDPACYERIILGTPVWAGTFAPPLRSFVAEQRDALQGKQISAFACCSGSGAEKALGQLRDALNIPAFQAQLILIDPKSRPAADTPEKIERFCKAVQHNQQ